MNCPKQSVNLVDVTHNLVDHNKVAKSVITSSMQSITADNTMTNVSSRGNLKTKTNVIYLWILHTTDKQTNKPVK